MAIDGSSRSDNAGGSFWPSFSPFKVSAYLLDQAGYLYSRCFQATPTREDIHNIYDAPHIVNGNTQ